MSSLGQRIRSLREKRGLSQKNVADELGISNVQLSRYESGDRNPDSSMIAALAKYYGVSTDYLHGGAFFTVDYLKAINPEEIMNDFRYLIDDWHELGNERSWSIFDFQAWMELSREDVRIILEHFELVRRLRKEEGLSEQKD